MSKAVISVRLEKSVVEALDGLGPTGPHQGPNRSQVIETILKLFLEQDVTIQRTAVTQALGGYRRRRGGNAPP